MEKIKQDNFLDSKAQIITGENASETEEPAEPEIVQFVPSQEALDRIAELERQYRETVERENK